MLGRRERPPVLARVPGRPAAGTRPHRLDRSELEAFSALREAVGETGVELFTREEGDPSVVVGLAAAFVAEGRSAVVVECDLRQPVLAEALGLAAAPGLAEYLRGEAEAAAVLQPIVLAGPASGRALEPLLCIAGGAPAKDGPALLASEDFRRAIGNLRRAYDLVALDAPRLEDDQSLAVAPHADRIFACRPDRRVPKRLRNLVDGVVVTAPAAVESTI